ncbi:MAG: hypothetical protein HC859_15525 [Bacteroidia bacterium]|nr:hypothetical protein [Bacteroidia bacterium]
MNPTRNFRILLVIIRSHPAMKCSSGKRTYASETMAEDALIEAWSRYHYTPGQGPVAIYRCDDCGQWHFTSQGPMNTRLAGALKSGKISLSRAAEDWLQKLNRR